LRVDTTVGERGHGAFHVPLSIEGRRQRGIKHSTESRTPQYPALSNEQLKPGMTTDVDIITDSKRDALYVPSVIVQVV